MTTSNRNFSNQNNRSSFNSDQSVTVSDETYTGTVKWFNSEKFFGFISRDDQQESKRDGKRNGGRHDDKGDVFVHISALGPPARKDKITLNEGDRVQFNLEFRANNKVSAVNIKKIDSEE